jgi:hypothetical protein
MDCCGLFRLGDAAARCSPNSRHGYPERQVLDVFLALMVGHEPEEAAPLRILGISVKVRRYYAVAAS